jgi:hypothetical protein
MEIDAEINRLAGDIAAVGALTSEVARRYEGLFSGFQQRLNDVLKHTSSMSEAAHATMQLVDAASEAMQTSFPNPPKYDCRDGCDACCHLFVAVPPGVVPLVADYIQANFTKDEQAALHQRLATTADIIAKAENPLWARARCPLLGEDGRCTIYSVRPLACRAFTSRSAPRCHSFVFETPPDAGGSVDQNPAHYRFHLEASKALSLAARARGLPTHQTGFVQTLLEELTSATPDPA